MGVVIYINAVHDKMSCEQLLIGPNSPNTPRGLQEGGGSDAWKLPTSECRPKPIVLQIEIILNLGCAVEEDVALSLRNKKWEGHSQMAGHCSSFFTFSFWSALSPGRPFALRLLVCIPYRRVE